MKWFSNGWKNQLAPAFLAPALLALLLLTACDKQAGARARPVVCEHPITIGVMINPSTQEGKEQDEGYKIAEQEIKDAGGVQGCQIQLVYAPPSGSETSTENIQESMLDLDSQDKVVAILGATSNDASKRTAAIAEYIKTPVILTPDAADDVLDGSRWVFRINPSFKAYAGAVASLIKANPSLGSKVAILFEDTEYGENAAVTIGNEVLAQKLQISSYERFASAAKDFAEPIEAIRLKAPGFVYIISSDSVQALAILKEIQKQSVLALVIGSGSGFNTASFLYQADGSLIPGLKNLVLTVPWVPGQNATDYDTIVQAYRSAGRLKETHSSASVPATVRSVQAYTALHLLVDAIQKTPERDAAEWNAILTEPDKLAGFREEILNALRGNAYDTPLGRLEFDSAGQSKLEGYLVQIENGQMVIVYPKTKETKPPVLVSPQGALP